MQPDYPAAHSMDTMFFAVDRDGHVAVFSSGEAGAVPRQALAEDEAYQLQEQLAANLPRCEEIHDPDGRKLPGDTAEGMRRAPTLDYPVLVFLTSLDPIAGEIESGSAFAVRSTRGAAAIFQSLSSSRFQQLAAAGAVVDWTYVFNERLSASNGQPTGDGLFHYDHITENWISGPYGRERVPTRPLHVDELPPATRRRLREVVFEKLSFAETPHLQPVEHVPCESWENAWLDLAGTIRPIPGREAEYAENYADMKELGVPYKLQPPEGESA